MISGRGSNLELHCAQGRQPAGHGYSHRPAAVARGQADQNRRGADRRSQQNHPRHASQSVRAGQHQLEQPVQVDPGTIGRGEGERVERG